MGVFYWNKPFWSGSVWMYHSYQFDCYISIKQNYKNCFKKPKLKLIPFFSYVRNK